MISQASHPRSVCTGWTGLGLIDAGAGRYPNLITGFLVLVLLLVFCCAVLAVLLQWWSRSLFKKKAHPTAYCTVLCFLKHPFFGFLVFPSLVLSSHRRFIIISISPFTTWRFEEAKLHESLPVSVRQEHHHHDSPTRPTQRHQVIVKRS